MMKYEVKLTEEAKQDRKSLARFIKEEVHVNNYKNPLFCLTFKNKRI